MHETRLIISGTLELPDVPRAQENAELVESRSGDGAPLPRAEMLDRRMQRP